MRDPVDDDGYRDGRAIRDRFTVHKGGRGVDIESVLWSTLNVLFDEKFVDRGGTRADRLGLPVANERYGFLAFDAAGEQCDGPVGERSRADGHK
jgi:hypothetical protein